VGGDQDSDAQADSAAATGKGDQLFWLEQEVPNSLDSRYVVNWNR
jgi:hypothetical protein